MTKRTIMGGAGVALGLLMVLAALAVDGSDARATFSVLVDASPDTDTNLVGEDHTVTAVVTADGEPAQDWEVTFLVVSLAGADEPPAPNQGDSGTDVTDSNGEATFTYTGDGGAGTDQIEVCVTEFVGPAGVSSAGENGFTDCEIVEKTWVDPTPTPTPPPDEPSATPTATPAEAAPAAELPDTGSQPPSGGEFPWLGALALALVGAMMVGGGWALSKRSR